MKSLMTIKEVSDILQVNERTVMRLIKSKKIPAIKVGNQWRFHPAKLESWFLSGGDGTIGHEQFEFPKSVDSWTSEEDFQIFSVNRTLLDIDCRTKFEALKVMVEGLSKAGHLLQPYIFYQAVVDREKTLTTGIGNGVAIPHGWHPINDLFRVPMVMSARLSHPIGWQAVDEEPVDLVFMLCSPRSKKHLRLLATMSSITKEKEILQELRSAQTPDDFVSLLSGTVPAGIE